MILVDTNIIIDFWRFHTAEYKKIFDKEDIAICGIVKAELLRGAKDETEFQFMEKSLSKLHFYDLDSDDWDSIGRFLYILKKKGIAVPLADAIIAFLAVKNSVALWTNDSHFSMIKTCLPELKLFNP